MLVRSAFSSVKIAWLREPRVNTLCGGHRANLHKSVAFSRRLKFLDAAFTLEVKNHEEQPFASLWIRCLKVGRAHSRNEKGTKVFWKSKLRSHESRLIGEEEKATSWESMELLRIYYFLIASLFYPITKSGENSSADIGHLSLEINNFKVDLYNL